MPKTTTIEMTVEKKCKHSIRYATSDSKAPVSNAYVSNGAFDPMPEKIYVTISDTPPAPKK